MRKKMVAGNWKMHGNLVQNKQLLDAVIADLNELGEDLVVVCVPYLYLPSVQKQLQNTKIALGAQNVSQHEMGAYTGEISASMLSDFQCQYVIVGHSERRMLFGEDNHVVAKKYVAVQNAGMAPILCVGETLEQREAKVTKQVIEQQLMSVISLAGVESFNKAVIAYEPVWAIGTGKTATPEQAQDVHAFIREEIAKQNLNVANQLTILYGGSVKDNNAPELFAMPDIDGGLIGGASLIANDFIAICRALRH
ncbi:MAG: triose-phosphate isomerase [Nitrosomonas sp.]|uniref:triose-phosphate isomerase n=1 Tax=Nitrosomonas sp. TaxID=42353 RepID=UPI0025D50E30|nr:triose-phosphate isomerase [Nitrosomonas sp.]MBY0474841.1 triose-phosphate isomerase [Nitrosomonas sp.]